MMILYMNYINDNVCRRLKQNQLFLLLMKSIYNLNSAPFLIAIDTESYFLLGSKYNISVS
jgi:hypothetical protein